MREASSSSSETVARWVAPAAAVRDSTAIMETTKMSPRTLERYRNAER